MLKILSLGMTTLKEKRVNPMPKFIFLACLCGVLSLGCVKRGKEDEESGQGGGAAPVVDVKLDSLIVGSIEDFIIATGKTDVLKRENIASPFGGKILSLKATEGMSVKPGEVVAVIRTKESESAMDGAETLLRTAHSEAEKSEAQRAVELARTTQSTVSLRAKQGGVVSSRLVQEGEQVSENENLMSILDLSTLDFQAEVPLTNVGSVRVGQAVVVSLQSLPDKDFNARVDAILPQIQALSQTLSIRLKFTPTKGSDIGIQNLLKTDMFGEARIILSTRPRVLLAPKAALLRNDEDGSYSLVTVGADTVAHTVTVQAGTGQGTRIEVMADGLVAGTKVVVQGQHGMADSTKVHPVP